MSLIKKLWRKIAPNPLDSLLKRAKGNKVLIIWNRGLGDIALGLYAMLYRIKELLPTAEVSFLIRKDLEEGFAMLEGAKAIIAPEMMRGKPFAAPPSLASSFDVVIENADPTYWVAWQRGFLTPKLQWDMEKDALAEKFGLPENCIGAHVSCETNYYEARNWPQEKWQELFSLISDPVVLFGKKKEPLFSGKNIYDLRGEMSLYELLAVIKGRCKALIAPDSGVLSMAYFLNVSFPLHIISLWADPNHGILKQNVASPNTLLRHTPLFSPDKKNAALISVEEVRKCLKT